MNNVKMWGVYYEKNHAWIGSEEGEKQPNFSFEKESPRLAELATHETLEVAEIPIEIIALYQELTDAAIRMLTLLDLDYQMGQRTTHLYEKYADILRLRAELRTVEKRILDRDAGR